VNRILIKCPKTGKLVYTGFAMDAQTFEMLPIEEQDPIKCPACKQMHRWKKRDAIFERETPTTPSENR
jgi:phage FluMu protein Com